MKNFLTASIGLEVDSSKLNPQLAKVKQRVVKSVSDIEKYFKKNVTHSFRLVTNSDKLLKKMDKMRSISGTLAWYSKKFGSNLLKVNNTTARATTLMKSLSGETIRINHALSGWNLRALDFYRRMKQNLALLEKMGSIVKRIAVTFGQGLVWSVKKAYTGIKRLTKASAEVAGEINKGFVMPSLSLLLHPIKTLRSAVEAWLDEGQRHQTEWNDSIQETAERLYTLVTATRDVRDALKEEVELYGDRNKQLADWNRMSKVAENMAGLGWERKARQETIEERDKRINQVMKSARDVSGQHGPKLQMVLFGVPGMFTAIYDAAKWAFGGILDIVTSVFQKIFDTSIWFKTGVIAAFVGMYYKITQAAMDAEDALSFDELGATRTTLKRFKDALTEVLAALGKPFLSGIQTVSNALAEWLEKSTPKITAWAEKFAKKLDWLRNAFVDWTMFLATDFKGGVDIALKIVLELFKTFGAILVITVRGIGYKVGKALVTGIADGLEYVVESSLDKVKKIINESIEESRVLLKLGISAFPKTGNVPYTIKGARPPRVETPEGKIESRLKEGLAKIETLLAGMPTWGDTEAAAAKKNKPIIMAEMSAMAEHRRKMLEQGATLSDSEWAIQNERMIAESEFALEKLKKAQDFAATRQGMLKALDFEFDLLGRTNDERERAIELANFQAELAKDVSLSTERQNELMDEYASKLDRLIEKQGSLGHTVQLWMNKVGEMGKNLGNLLTSTFDRMADSLADALMGMKMDWKAFARMFIKQLLAMIIKLQIAFAIQTAMGLSNFGATAPSGLSYIPAGAGPGGLQHGGEVLTTGWAKVHKGEKFSGVNNEQGFGNVTINNYASDKIDIETEQVDQEQVINVMLAGATDGRIREAYQLG